MVKPAYDKIKQVAPHDPTIIFVPSRTQCSNTAQDLITRLASELDTEAFLGVPPATMEGYVQALQDKKLEEALFHGIGIYHDGINPQDRALCIELFRTGVIRILIVPRETCWSLPARAKLVIIMGTQYLRLVPVSPTVSGQITGAAYDRKTVDYAMTDLVRMQSFAVRRGNQEEPNPAGECLVLCQSSSRNLLHQIMNSGLPLTSELTSSTYGLDALALEIVQLVADGTLKSPRDIVDLLSWSFLFHDMQRNPTYYDSRGTEAVAASDRLSDLVDDLLAKLKECDCLLVAVDASGIDRVGSQIKSVTTLGKTLLASRRPGALGRCLDLFEQCRGQAEAAARACWDGLDPSVLQKGLQTDEGLLGTALEALRLRVPGDYLAAFQVPRPTKAARKAGRKVDRRQNGDDHTTTTTAEATSSANPGETAEAAVPTVAASAEGAEEDASTLQAAHVSPLLLAGFFAAQHPETGSAASAGDVALLRKRRDYLLSQLFA